MIEVVEDKYYTIEEYLELDALGEAKYEYLSGKVTAMTGGTLNHGLIASNALLALTVTNTELWLTNSTAIPKRQGFGRCEPPLG